MNNKKELRLQYMLPEAIRTEQAKLPLVILPLAPLEWHGPHLALGVDPINAEQTALAVADKVGGVVHPTLYMGTERERPPEMLESLGFAKDDYVVGMDFPKAKGIHKSYYFTEGLFALTVRAHIEQCISHGYKYIFIVNGHGATNHNDVLKRLCLEFTNETPGVVVEYAIAFPGKMIEAGFIGHADKYETSLMMYFNPEFVELINLPASDKALKYTGYSIVDDGGFSGNPGKDHAVPPELDPRTNSSVELGKTIFEDTVRDICEKVMNML